MEDLKSFIQNERAKNEYNVNVSDQPTANTVANNPQEIYDKYKNMSQSELMSELLKEVSNRKANGTFSPENVMNFASKVAPMLNETQRNELNNILNMIGAN